MGERNGQFTLLACGQIEDNKEERGPPERQCVLNMCIHEEGEGGSSPARFLHEDWVASFRCPLVETP